MKDSYEKRVDKGIKFLSKRDPKWFRKINIQILDIKSHKFCVCGQLHFWPIEALEPLGMYSSIPCGSEYKRACARLTKIWKEKIKKLIEKEKCK